LANPLLLVGAVIAFLAMSRKKETASPAGDTSPPDPEKGTPEAAKAAETVKREKGNTTLEMVDEIVKEIGLKPDAGWQLPQLNIALLQYETLFSYVFRLAASIFKERFGSDFYLPSATPVNSDTPRTNFAACNMYYLAEKNISIGGKSWPAGTMLHCDGQRDDIALILANANASKCLVELYPDREWEKIYDEAIEECIKAYIKSGTNAAARLLMFCILCAESFGVAVVSNVRYNFTGMKVLSLCQKALPKESDWLFKQFVRYFGVVRFATFKPYVAPYIKSGNKDFLKKMFGCFEAGDYAKTPLLKTLKAEAGL